MITTKLEQSWNILQWAYTNIRLDIRTDWNCTAVVFDDNYRCYQKWIHYLFPYPCDCFVIVLIEMETSLFRSDRWVWALMGYIRRKCSCLSAGAQGTMSAYFWNKGSNDKLDTVQFRDAICLMYILIYKVYAYGNRLIDCCYMS